MPSSEESALCAGVAKSLAGVDARRCLDEAIALLACHGIVLQTESDVGPTWLRVERDGELLRLRAETSVPEAATRELLAALLAAAIARKADAREHERTRERMDMLSAASFEGIMIHVDRQAIDVNQRISDMFGYTREEMLHEGAFARCVAPEDQAMAADRVARRLEGTYLMHGVRKDGSRFLAEVQSKQGQFGDRPVRVVALRDVTERECTSALLRESELRLHQLVEATFDYVALSRSGIIIEVSGATEAVLGVSHAEMVGRTVLSFIAPEQVPLWGDIIGENRIGVFETVVVSSTGERVPVEVVAVRSTLDGEPVRLPKWNEALGVKPGPGEWVQLQVRDTGAGMDEATGARIFEPFFSTKAKGHGLGLAACLGIVAAHGGAIRVESTFGVGTCFSLLLPALGSEPQRVVNEPQVAEPKACKVLVVDDDPLVRANIRYTLKPRGFHVVEAPDGESALALFPDLTVDLLIVDFTMPDMDGAEVVRRLRASGCTIPILLSSGHVESDLLRSLPVSSIQGILHKPFGPKFLLAAIERALGSAVLQRGDSSPRK